MNLVLGFCYISMEEMCLGVLLLAVIPSRRLSLELCRQKKLRAQKSKKVSLGSHTRKEYSVQFSCIIIGIVVIQYKHINLCYTSILQV